MRLTFNNTIYRINFRHGKESRNIPGLGPVEQDYTIAQIRTGERDSTDNNNDNIAASAVVRRFYGDTPSFEAARKAALKAALRSLNSTEAFRTAVWLTYHQRPGGILASTKAQVASASSN